MVMKQKIVLAGGSGLLGGLLSNHFLAQNCEVIVLSRQPSQFINGVRYINWDAKHQGEWVHCLEGADLVVNLNGKSVDCRYTVKNKQLIYSSRIDATQALGEAILNCRQAPRCWINASSATIYRHSQDKAMDEFNGEIGEGFSVDVCRQWEQSFEAFQLPNTRKIVVRIGIVLTRVGGALQPLTRLVKFGVGGKQGSGQQFMSLIHETDFIRSIEFLYKSNHADGIYNLVSPRPIRNENFMFTLRKALGVPFGVSLPLFALKLGAILISTETELITKSRRVAPTRLLKEGFLFKFHEIEDALKDLKN